jgi:hypothetical protein
MAETVSLRRCRRCGKWSFAKRDPIAHKPRRPETEDAPYWEWREEWCGPFDRWEATLAEGPRRGELPHAGQPVDPAWREEILVSPEMDEAPF